MMEPVVTFINRLKKIGIQCEFFANYPWIYLDKVNGKKVHGKFKGNHGFTAFWSGIKPGDKAHMTDIGIVFAKIRETLKQEN